MVKQRELGEFQTKSLQNVTFAMLDKTKGVMQRDLTMSIRESLKKGFWFGYDDIFREAKYHFGISVFDINAMIRSSLNELGLKESDLLSERG